MPDICETGRYSQFEVKGYAIGHGCSVIHVQPIRFPNLARMKIARHREQHSANGIEYEPCNEETGHRTQERPGGTETQATTRSRDGGDAREAARADNAILMLDDALPAKEPTTLRAAGHGFAASVMQTTLESQRRHSGEESEAGGEVAGWVMRTVRLSPTTERPRSKGAT